VLVLLLSLDELLAIPAEDFEDLESLELELLDEEEIELELALSVKCFRYSGLSFHITKLSSWFI
jgi:hypothetical protein